MKRIFNRLPSKNKIILASFGIYILIIIVVAIDFLSMD